MDTSISSDFRGASKSCEQPSMLKLAVKALSAGRLLRLAAAAQGKEN